MAHDAQRGFIERTKNIFPHMFDNVSVLEVGSWNVNGTVRDFFTNQVKYIGLDLAEGHCVDIVCSGAKYDTDIRFDTTISTECFEHDAEWKESFANMIRLTKPNGLVVFTCASYNREEHGTPRTTPDVSLSSQLSDYYMNLGAKEFTENFNLSELFIDWYFENDINNTDLYFWGIRR